MIGAESRLVPDTGLVPYNKTNSFIHINSLPQYLLARIFSLLGKQDLQTAVLLDRSKSISVIKIANFNQRVKIKKFIDNIVQRLNPKIFPVQKKTLLEILNNITDQEFLNLRLLKQYTLDVRTQLIDVIKTFDTETEKNLRDNLNFPHFFENIFELAEFERQIDKANLNPNKYRRGFTLGDISLALVHGGNIDRAIAVATSIPTEENRAYAFGDISLALAKAGNIDRAIAVATSIPNEHRSVCLESISLALARAGRFEEAILMATLIPNASGFENAFQYIYMILKQAGN